jgi:hypothetical protein
MNGTRYGSSRTCRARPRGTYVAHASRGPFELILAVLAVLAILPQPLAAEDVEVEAKTALQFYDTAAPGSIVVWSRRRLTQTLSLRYVRSLYDEARDGGPSASAPRRDELSPKLSVHLLLRLNQEFGDTCLLEGDVCYAIVNPERRGSYIPIVENGLLDIPSGYIEISELPFGAWARVGRQLHSNVIGFARIDGVGARITPASFIAFESTFGALVRRTSFAGSDAFVPTSAPRVELDPLERLRAPYIDVPVTTYVADGSAELGEERIVRGSLAYRALIENGGVVQRRVGAGLWSQPTPGLRLSTHGVLDALDASLIDAQIGGAVWLGPYTARLELERQVPNFDAGSIWAYFDVAPTWRLAAHLARQIQVGWDAFVGLQGRRTELSPDPEHDAGVSGGTSIYTPKNDLFVSGFGWTATSGPLWGASANGLHRFTRIVAFEAELSMMRIDDPLRSVMQGVSIAELVGTRLQLTDDTELRLIAAHSYSRPMGNRLAALALLQLGAFR